MAMSMFESDNHGGDVVACEQQLSCYSRDRKFLVRFKRFQIRFVKQPPKHQAKTWSLPVYT